MICNYCNERILYEVVEFDSMNFCNSDCLDEYVKENTTTRDLDRDEEINNYLNI